MPLNKAETVCAKKTIPLSQTHMFIEASSGKSGHPPVS